MSAAPLQRLLRASLLCLAAVNATAAVAHEFWIEPSNFRPAIDEEVSLTLRVGFDLVGDSLPYIHSWFERYVVVTPKGEQPVEALMGDDPAGAFRPPTAGVYTVVYRSARDVAEMDSALFRGYLRREGLEHIAGTYAAKLEPTTIVREHYARCAKALIVAGDPPPEVTGHDRVLGLEIELIAERNPIALQAGEDLPVLLLYRGQPLAGALVNAYGSADPERPISARADANGRVVLNLPESGIWLINAVHMFQTKSSGDLDWQSEWASLTFSLGAGRGDKREAGRAAHGNPFSRADEPDGPADW